MSSASRREVDELLSRLEATGCTVRKANSGHWRVAREGCPNVVTVPATPGDRRSLLNVRSKIRRYLGIDI